MSSHIFSNSFHIILMWQGVVGKNGAYSGEDGEDVTEVSLAILGDVGKAVEVPLVLTHTVDVVDRVRRQTSLKSIQR